MRLKKPLLFIGRHKKAFLGVLALILVIIFLIVRANKPDIQTLTLTTENLAFSGVTVGGTVIAQNEVELSFQASGRVAQVNKKAGDRVSRGELITSLDTASLSANLLKAQADLDGEIAKLEEIKFEEKIDSAELQSKKNQLVREIQNAYTVAEDSIKNKTDQFFENAESRFPKMFFIFDDYDLRQDINDQRYEIGRILKSWEPWAYGATKDTYTEQNITDTKNNITKVQSYLNLVASAVNQFEATETYSQTTIDKYKTDTSSARTSMNGALADLIAAQQIVQTSSSQIPFQEARIKSAQATVQSYQAEIEKSYIRAPYVGLITRQDAKVGMSTIMDQPVITLISDSNYGIEAFIPEIYISQVQIGTKARVTLNSYGTEDIFNATVTYVDPAASLKDGVASYKIELVFDQNDGRIMSGMTADVELLTQQTNDSFWIPSTTIIDQNGMSYVKIKAQEGVELRKIELGERTPEQTEVLSGLIVGDQIILENK